MEYKLEEIAEYSNKKIEVDKINCNNYISTENMLPNKLGIVKATSLPNQNKVCFYEKNNILISNIRPYFKKIWFANCEGGCSNDVLNIMVSDTKKALPKFLYYILFQDDFFDYVMAGSKGTKMPRGDKKHIMRYTVNIPSIEKQIKIIDILDNIDKKIEINNKINANLFNGMETLYNSWFNKYEPFNMISPKETEIGMIPKTFNIKDIYSICNIIYGVPFKSKLFNENKKGIPIVRIRDLKNQELKTYTTEVHPNGYLIQKGDIVVGMDGEFRPYLWGNDEAWLNQRVCVFENKRNKGKAFLYYTIKPLLKYVEKTEFATTVIHIGKNDFDKFKIVLPDEDTLNKFDNITNPMINKVIENMKENKNLKQLRDTLLPKLMNGEINLDKIEI